MNLRDLHYLTVLAEARHFGKAALACHVSQPTLSMQLKKLEELLGVTLFERSNKQVTVTPVGERIAAQARLILREVDGLHALAKAAQDPLAGELRLGAFPTLAPYYLPVILPLLRERLPRLKLLLVEEKTDQLLKRLKEGTLDAAFLALPVEQEGLETAALFEDPFLLAVPQGHALSVRKCVAQEDIAQESLLLLEDGHCLRAQALEVCSLMGASEQGDFRATSLETLRQMVAAGVGITLMPQMAARKGDGIAYIPFEAPAPVRTVGLVWRKTTARREALERMREVLALV